MERADTFFKVAKSDELKPGESKIVHAGVKKIALFNKDGEFFAIQNFCPHAGGYLGLGDFKGCIVKCPRHSWGFDITTGECKTDPRYSVKQYEVIVEDGYIKVGLPSEDPVF